MTPEEFRQWYDRLGLSQRQLAKRLDVDQPRIGKWLRGEVKISGYLYLALERLEQILAEERKPKRSRRPTAPPPALGPAGEVEG
jgi:transcriptional regulator with XRE-family HTH domain